VNRTHSWKRVSAIVGVLLLAVVLRGWAVLGLPIDYDEDDYLRAGQQYAQGLQSGDLSVFTRENYRTEHPPLVKIVYGATLAMLPPAEEIPDRPTTAQPATSLPQPHLWTARSVSAGFNTLVALLVALLDPLAGLFMAIHSFSIKYSAQTMLEGLPTLTSLLVVLAYHRSEEGRKPGWVVLSAVMLGLTAASKYLYCVAGLAVLVHWLWRRFPEEGERNAKAVAQWLLPVIGWGMLALATFFAADPYLWPDPLNRLRESVFFHGGYAQSKQVQDAGYPVWQPLVWLLSSVPWHPGVIVIGLDMFVSILAAFGARRLWHKAPVFVLWFGMGLAFLFVWPTKWPQYVLILIPPVTLAAAEGFRERLWNPWRLSLKLKATRPPVVVDPAERKRSARALQRAWIWMAPGLLALALVAFFPLIYQGAMALTDFRAMAIKDGVNGGVWRAVWQGMTGQEKAVHVDPFSPSMSPTRTVRYAGPELLINLFGNVSDLLVFEIIWTLLTVASQLALGVGVALLLNRRGVKLKGWWRALFILPWAIPEFVGAISWSQVFEPRFGWLSLAANSWSNTPPGVTSLATGWQENPQYALLVLLVAGLWYGFPFMFLAATAGLKLIPDDVYEAAALDGAGIWAQFQKITWPLLFPLLAPAIILRAIYAFNQFYLFTVLRTPYPVMTFATLSYYIFNPGGGGGMFAVSAALNVITVLILVVLVFWFDRITGATEGVTYA